MTGAELERRIKRDLARPAHRPEPPVFPLSPRDYAALEAELSNRGIHASPKSALKMLTGGGTIELSRADVPDMEPIE